MIAKHDFRFGRLVAYIGMATSLLLTAGSASAEVSEVRIAQQFGVNYLPLTVMKKHQLVEKHAQRLGLPAIKVTWTQFGAGNVMNEALFAGSLDIASGGGWPVAQDMGQDQGQPGRARSSLARLNADVSQYDQPPRQIDR